MYSMGKHLYYGVLNELNVNNILINNVKLYK